MKRKGVYPLIIISLILLFNPSANILDILPDCIAYALLIYAIGQTDKTIPYLAECKGALIKLAVVTLVKIPAFFIMYANMKHGSDIVPLFTLSFAAVEIILVRIALKNLFLALSYIGERTDCASVRDPFPLNKKRTVSPDTLYGITLGFYIAKSVISIIPELLLLSREDLALKRELNEVYPTVLVFAVLIALVIGVIWLRLATKYVKAIKDGGDLGAAIDYVKRGSHTVISDTERREKKLLGALTLLAVSSLFAFDLTFENLGGYNILPHFIYVIILYFAIRNLTENKKARTWLTASMLPACASGLINQICTMRFLKAHQYVELSYSANAKASYLSVKISAVFETVFIIAMAVVCSWILAEFIREHTEVLPSDPSYTRSNEKAHKRLIKMLAPLPLFASVINVLKCVNTFIKQNVKLIGSEVNTDGIVTSTAPFMNTLIFLVTAVFVVYSFTAVSTVKDEVKLKYSK